MLGSDWPHAEGVADPMAQATAGRGRAGGAGPVQHAGSQRGVAPRPVTIDLERGRRRSGSGCARRTCRNRQARPPSTARGVHHVALLCSDVERTIRFYQGLLGFPLAELFENRDYKGSTHLFFDLGHDNTLAFFDFPDLGPQAVLRSARRVPPPRDLGRPGAVGRRAGPPRGGGHPHADRERDLAVLLGSRRRASRAHRRGSRLAVRHARCTDGRHGPGQPGRQGRRPRAGLRLVRGGGRDGDRAGRVGERSPRRRPARAPWP